MFWEGDGKQKNFPGKSQESEKKNLKESNVKVITTTTQIKT